MITVKLAQRRKPSKKVQAEPGKSIKMEPLEVPVGKITPAMITEILDKHAVAELPDVAKKAELMRGLYEQQVALIKEIAKIEGITADSEAIIKLLNGIDLKSVMAAEDEHRRLTEHVKACGDGRTELKPFESGLVTLSTIAAETCGSAYVVEVATGTEFQKFRHVDEGDFESLCNKIWEVSPRFLGITFPGLLETRKGKQPPPSDD